MAGRLQDKVVVITGAGTDVDAEAGEATASACRDAFFQPVAVTDTDSVSRMCEATASYVRGATSFVEGGITAHYVMPE